MLEGREGLFTIKPIKRTWLPESSDGHVLFSGVKKVLGPQFSLKERQYVTGLTNEEARALEEELSLTKNTLSPSNKAYWGSYHIPVSKEGEIIDISKPQDYLKYKVLKANTLVATSQEDMQGERGLMAEVMMVSDAKEAETESKKAMLEIEAIDSFKKMSLSDYIDFLMVAFPSKKLSVSDKHKPDFLQTEVYKVVKNKPKEFLSLVNDKYYKGKIMVEKCIQLGALTRDGSKYLIAGDIDPFAHNLTDAIDYIYDPKNQATLISLKSKMETVN